MIEDVAGVVVLEVHEDGGDDLRVFVANEVGDRRRVHPFEAFDAVGVAALQNARNQVGRFVVAERLGQDRAHVGVAVDVHRRRFGRRALEVGKDFLDLGPGHRLQAGHGVAELLDFFRPEVFEDFRCVILAQGDEQDGALLDAVVSWHWRPSSP